MAIDSTSTLAQIEVEYLDTASYLQDASRDKALRHAIAIRFLLFKVPTNTIKGSNSVSYSMSLLRDELTVAERFAKQNSPSGGSNFIRTSNRRLRANG